MANLIQHKRSSVAAAIPNSVDLELGELAINTTDKRLFMKDGTNTVITLNNTDNVEEGSNLYYTDTRARAAISVVDTAGDGSLSYNSATGVLSYAGISDAQVRVKFSAAGDLNYNAATGEFEFTERTDAQVRALISATGDLSYNATTGEITFTERTDSEVRNLVSATGDIAYNSATGQFSYTKQTPAQLLTAIKTVDGTGTGLDADLLDGSDGAYYLNYNNFTGVPILTIQWAVVTSGVTLDAYDGAGADTTGGPFTVTFPSTPVVGDEVAVRDIAGTFNTNNLTLSGNGNTIETAASVVLSTDGFYAKYAFFGASYGWLQVG